MSLIFQQCFAGQGKVVPVHAIKAYVIVELSLHSFLSALLHTRPHYAQRKKKLQVFCSYLFLYNI